MWRQYPVLLLQPDRQLLPVAPRPTAAGYRCARPGIRLRLSPVQARFPSFSVVFGLEKLYRLGRHDRGNGMFINQLRVRFPAKQHGKIIEPGDNPLQFHTVYQKYGYPGFSACGAHSETHPARFAIFRSFCLSLSLRDQASAIALRTNSLNASASLTRENRFMGIENPLQTQSQAGGRFQ